jgi:hypothetical protein
MRGNQRRHRAPFCVVNNELVSAAAAALSKASPYVVFLSKRTEQRGSAPAARTLVVRTRLSPHFEILPT